MTHFGSYQMCKSPLESDLLSAMQKHGLAAPDLGVEFLDTPEGVRLTEFAQEVAALERQAVRDTLEFLSAHCTLLARDYPSFVTATLDRSTKAK